MSPMNNSLPNNGHSELDNAKHMTHHWWLYTYCSLHIINNWFFNAPIKAPSCCIVSGHRASWGRMVGMVNDLHYPTLELLCCMSTNRNSSSSHTGEKTKNMALTNYFSLYAGQTHKKYIFWIPVKGAQLFWGTHHPVSCTRLRPNIIGPFWSNFLGQSKSEKI